MLSPLRRRMGSTIRSPNCSSAETAASLHHSENERARETDPISSSISRSAAMIRAPTVSAALTAAANSFLLGSVLASSSAVNDLFRRLGQRIRAANKIPPIPPPANPRSTRAGSDSSATFGSAAGFRGGDSGERPASLSRRIFATRDGATSMMTARGRTDSMRRAASSADFSPMWTVPKTYTFGRGRARRPFDSRRCSLDGNVIVRTGVGNGVSATVRKVIFPKKTISRGFLARSTTMS
mmetsp:Transcript_1994/g.4327  ORF Transcript_1994/g.4327 Transcript_1994/m.4327 type:complete len:239 (-) Transcript_1994:71-787(-)